MLCCEYCETVKNNIFTGHLGTPASVFINISVVIVIRNGRTYDHDYSVISQT